jgi:hypothetical protein
MAQWREDRLYGGLAGYSGLLREPYRQNGAQKRSKPRDQQPEIVAGRNEDRVDGPGSVSLCSR